MISKIKDLAMPLAIVIGIAFNSFFSKFIGLTPFLIFVMLYFTLSSMDFKKIRISMLHIYIVLFQILISTLAFFLLMPINPIIAQGVMVTIITPTATSAPVVAAMLGANISTMVSSTLITNLALALFSPLIFSFTGMKSDLTFLQSAWAVIAKVAPMIIFPLALAFVTRQYLPKLTSKITQYKSVSFYLWVIGLTIVIGSTVKSIINMDHSLSGILIAMFVVSLLTCIIQFAYGRFIGKFYGEVVAGGQSSGQKNTVLAIWMAQTYLNPLASVIPASYVLWQNLFNSFQIWQKRKQPN
jgi:bile acid:Na+ symporter, BASS family